MRCNDSEPKRRTVIVLLLDIGTVVMIFVYLTSSAIAIAEGVAGRRETGAEPNVMHMLGLGELENWKAVMHGKK